MHSLTSRLTTCLHIDDFRSDVSTGLYAAINSNAVKLPSQPGPGGHAAFLCALDAVSQRRLTRCIAEYVSRKDRPKQRRQSPLRRPKKRNCPSRNPEDVALVNAMDKAVSALGYAGQLSWLSVVR